MMQNARVIIIGVVYVTVRISAIEAPSYSHTRAEHGTPHRVTQHKLHDKLGNRLIGMNIYLKTHD